jgi:hypothetical protein
MCVGVEVVTTWVAQQSPLECVRRRRALIEVSNGPEDVEEEGGKKKPRRNDKNDRKRTPSLFLTHCRRRLTIELRWWEHLGKQMATLFN